MENQATENQAMENQAEEKEKKERKYRILSLDGGGMRGIISARILKEIEKKVEEEHGQKLHEYFDLVAGTSTGSILAAGIACQKTAQELIDFYKEEGENIFISNIREQRRWRWLTRLFGTVVLYPHEESKQNWCLRKWLSFLGLDPDELDPDESKKKGLANVLREKLKYNGEEDKEKEPKITDSKIKENIEILILAYDVFTRNTTWFANTLYYGTGWYKDLELWKICTASASAPTFFPPYELKYYDKDYPGQNLPHIDGGVSANNPALSAIAHALSITKEGEKGSKLEQIAVLSIGTGITTKPYSYKEIKEWGILAWISNLTDIFVNPPDENSEWICRQILNNTGGDYLRLEFPLNKRLEGEKKDKGRELRSMLRKGKIYNKYIYEHKKKKKEICEAIDDHRICQDLIEAAEAYIECGTVKDKKSGEPRVRDEIERFIKSN